MAAVDFDRMRAQTRRFVQGFTPGQKVITVLGVIAVVIAGLTFMNWASKPQLTPLYTGLSSEEVGKVTQELDAAGVNYEITGGGGTVMVPKGDVYKVRADLGSKGIPSSSDSFHTFDEQGITTDQFTRNVNYQRALQEDLAQTISTINTVGSASVRLTIPQQTIFVGAEQDKASAAVVVTPASGSIPSGTVDAIVNIVSSSIPNMSPDDVTVADSTGRVLHAPGMAMGASGTAALEQQRAYEMSVEKKINDMIASTLGPGHAAVTVSAELDASSKTVKETTYQRPVAADGQPSPTDVPISQENNTETYTQETGTASGGTLGDAAAGGTVSGPTNYNRDQSSQTNALDTTETTAATPPGQVKQMKISVVLDSAAVKPPDSPDAWRTQIAAAAGVNPERDGADAVQVTSIAFNNEEIEAAAPQAPGGGANPMFDLIKSVLVLLTIALVLFFAWKAIKRAEANREPLRVALDVRELEGPSAGGGPLPLSSGGASVPAISPSLEQELSELIERQPEEVAQTLRSWLADRRG